MNQQDDASKDGQGGEPVFNTRDVTVIGLGRCGTNLVLSLGEDLTRRNDTEFMVCYSKEFKPERTNNVMTFGWNVSRSIWDEHEFSRQEKLDELDQLCDMIENLTFGTNIFILSVGAGGVFGSYTAGKISEFFSPSWAKMIAFVVMPFAGEGERRNNDAKVCIADLKRFCDVVVTVSNPRLLENRPTETLGSAFARVDRLFDQMVRKIIDARGHEGIDFVLDDPDGLSEVYINLNPRRDADRDQGRIYD
jgi:cell division protein FtsZ